MLRKISVSDLRAQIKRILNEVGYGQSEYIIERSGEPTAAIISIKDFKLLQEVKQQHTETEAKSSFLKKLEEIHQQLRESGYHSRTKEEIDHQIQSERGSWEG